MLKIKDWRIRIELCEGDFERSMGRRPRIRVNSMSGRAWLRKGLLNGHIDWDILYECSCDAMLRGGEGR